MEFLLFDTVFKNLIFSHYVCPKNYVCQNTSVCASVFVHESVFSNTSAVCINLNVLTYSFLCQEEEQYYRIKRIL